MDELQSEYYAFADDTALEPYANIAVAAMTLCVLGFALFILFI